MGAPTHRQHQHQHQDQQQPHPTPAFACCPCTSLYISLYPKPDEPPQDRTELLIPSAADSAQEAALLSRLRASTPAYVADDETAIPVRASGMCGRCGGGGRIGRQRSQGAGSWVRLEVDAGVVVGDEDGETRGVWWCGWGGCGEG